MPIPPKPSASSATLSAAPDPPRLLLLTGAPATGKTRLAAALATRRGACLCSKDEIKELLFDALGTGGADYSRRLSDASFALLFALLPRLLRPGRLLLLEGNFRPGRHEAADRTRAGRPARGGGAGLLPRFACHPRRPPGRACRRSGAASGPSRCERRSGRRIGGRLPGPARTALGVRQRAALGAGPGDAGRGARSLVRATGWCKCLKIQRLSP